MFYKPTDAWCADFIPFYKDGEFRLFYLHDWRDGARFGEGTAWYQIGTKDFVHFTEYGEALARGTVGEQDLWVFTGSVIEKDGVYHIFYTGHNPHLREQGMPEQAVMHAVSRDLLCWEKQPQDTFYAPADRYEIHDWRDPLVFWNDEAGEYWMLLAARQKSGPPRRRGCIALCRSKDLKAWRVDDRPFFAPHRYFAHECPDLFRMGDWWYLLYSTFTDNTVTNYRMSRSLSGPWLEPQTDTFDGRAFYAAKTYSDGKKRYIFGWNPTRKGETDDGHWQWGGHLVVHEVLQNPDGTLRVELPEPLAAACNRPLSLHFGETVGSCTIRDGGICCRAEDSFACALSDEPMADRCMLKATLSFGEGTGACGLMLRADDEAERAYYIRLEPSRNRLVFDRWPRAWDLPFAPELERPIALEPNRPYDLTVLIDGTVCEIYLDHRIAMSTRLYDLPTGRWGVFAASGSVELRDVRLLGFGQSQ